jgi:hypothetical protein
MDGSARQTAISRRGLVFYALAGALAVQGLSGVAGGIGLVTDPTGANVQIPIEWLQGSPFDSYWIPGWILLVVLGVGPLVAFGGLLRERPWARRASFAVGIALMVWIAVEIAVIGYHAQPPLQLVYGGLGIVIVGLAIRLRNG